MAQRFAGPLHWQDHAAPATRVIQFIPFISWLAAITSAVTMALLWTSGELGPRAGIALCSWFLVALYLQIFGASVMVAAIGLSLQTILAAYLSIRLTLSY